MQKAETPIRKRAARLGECRECERLREHRYRLLSVITQLDKERNDAKRLLDATLAAKRRGDWRWWEWCLYAALWAVMILILIRL